MLKHLFVLTTLLAAVLPAAGVAAPLDGASKVDPRLLAMTQAAPADTLPVWVEFQDKGERGPADLARRLGSAAAELDPHARARRERAGVRPLVDWLDLPVHEPYVQELEALGFHTFGASRWFNRVAVRVTGPQLQLLASRPCVSRLTPVERAVRMRDVPPERSPRSAVGAGLGDVTLAYGLAGPQLSQIQVPALHDSAYVGSGVRICVLDEGFNYFDVHPATRLAHVERRRDFVQGDYDPTDTLSAWGYNHGTWTASVIGGYAPGRFIGAAPGATFLLGRTEDSFSEHQIEMVWWGMGAEWADSLGADIISSSLGYNVFDPPDPSYVYADLDGRTTTISRAAEIAASKGILIVNSAGNEGGSPWHYIMAPADVNGDSLLAVGAVDATGVPATFSSWGPTADGRIKPDLAARGVSVWCAQAADTGYTQLSGTSFSCPLVAGLAACLMQARPTWSPRLVCQALRFTASQASNPDDRVGFGLPDGAAVLRYTPDTASVPDLAPGSFGLDLAGPNPISAAAPTACLYFAVAGDVGRPRLKVFDSQGRCVVGDLHYDPAPGGTAADGRFQARWDGRDSDGRLLRAGLYFITLEAGGRRTSVRVVTLR